MTSNDLIARIEAATGPSFALDCEIGRVFRPDRESWPAYSASLDAAMTLLPEGWRVSRLEEDWLTGKWIAQISERPTDGQRTAYADGLTIGWNTADAVAATPALALVSACLKARSRAGGEHDQ